MSDNAQPAASPSPEQTAAPVFEKVLAEAAEKSVDPPQPQPLLNGSGEPVVEEAAAEPAPPPAWPDDWRERMAKNDEGFLKTLKTYASPETWGKAGYDLRRQVGTGLLQEVLPDDATPERVAAYRQKAGIPETPEGYGIEFPNPLMASDEAKERLAFVLKGAHEANAHPKVVKRMMDDYFKVVEFEAQQRYDRGKEALKDTEVALRVEWGREYPTNINLANTTVAQFAEGAGKEIMQLPLLDGTVIGAHKEIVRMLANIGKALAPSHPRQYGDNVIGGKSPEEALEEAYRVGDSDWATYNTKAHQEKLLQLKNLVENRKQQRGRAA